MIDPWLSIGIVWLGSALAMAALWAFSMRVRNVGYVDVGWAGLMALAALLIGVVGEGSPMSRGLVAMFGSVWGARLCLHLLHRVLNEEEDGRYRALREAWGGSPAKFFGFFQMQAVVVALFALPFVAAADNDAYHLSGWTVLAIVVWLGAMAGESVADRQLAKFRADEANAGKTCRVGLWGWSRHPNYFFEWLHWFAYVFLAVGSGLFWLSLGGPVLMFAFLYRVSGIPWTEAQAERSRGEDYRRYQREVSAFFPWPPRKSSPSPE